MCWGSEFQSMGDTWEESWRQLCEKKTRRKQRQGSCEGMYWENRTEMFGGDRLYAKFAGRWVASGVVGRGKSQKRNKGKDGLTEQQS